MSETPYSQFKELRPEKKLVAKALEGLKFDSVLEVGSQWGEVLMGIKEKFPEAKLVGIDIDKPTIDAARSITNLDLRLGDALKNNFHNKEFDVVVADAFFCMLRPEDVKDAFGELVRIAKKYIVLVELKWNEIGIVRGGRTGANWEDLCQEYGLEVKSKKITSDMWDANPWLDFGYVYVASFDKEPVFLVNGVHVNVAQQVVDKVTKSWCDSCDSKGRVHKLACPKRKIIEHEKVKT